VKIALDFRIGASIKNINRFEDIDFLIFTSTEMTPSVNFELKICILGVLKSVAPDTGNSSITYKKLQKNINKDFVALSKPFNFLHYWSYFGTVLAHQFK